MELLNKPSAVWTHVTNVRVVAVVLLLVHCSHAITFFCNVCEPHTCDVTGACIEGCYKGSLQEDGSCAGKIRANCETNGEELCLSCKTGYYGSSCEFSCNKTCNDGRCNKQSGRCMQGLTVKPPKAAADAHLRKLKPIDKTRRIVLWVAGVFIFSVIGFVVGMIVFIRCKADRNDRKSPDDKYPYLSKRVPNDEASPEIEEAPADSAC